MPAIVPTVAIPDSALADMMLLMTSALCIQPSSVPFVSFKPFRFLEGMPWLVIAAGMRVAAFGGGLIAIPAVVAASIAVLHAFLVVAQRSIELADGQTSLGELDFREQSCLTWAILWRISLLMMAATLVLWIAGYPSIASNMLLGIDGMAFDLFTDSGKFWSATVAAIVLLTIVGAEQNSGRVRFFAAISESARRGAWVGGAVVVLGLVYLGLGVGQGLIRTALWNFWQTSSASQSIKSLIYFGFIFGFAMLRLWATLLILTYGLKQSYIRAARPTGTSSSRP